MRRPIRPEAFLARLPLFRDLPPDVIARLAAATAQSDAALAGSAPKELESMLVERVRAGLKQRYDAALHARAFDARDVAAGRAYVQAYVALVHYAEKLQEIADAQPHAPAAAADAHAAHRPAAPSASPHQH